MRDKFSCQESAQGCVVVAEYKPGGCDKSEENSHACGPYFVESETVAPHPAVKYVHHTIVYDVYGVRELSYKAAGCRRESVGGVAAGSEVYKSRKNQQSAAEVVDYIANIFLAAYIGAEGDCGDNCGAQPEAASDSYGLE